VDIAAGSPGLGLWNSEHVASCHSGKPVGRSLVPIPVLLGSLLALIV
jgi:hypothetical protein